MDENATKALFTGAAASYTEAEADTGGGNIMPDEGEHLCFFDRVEVQQNTTFKWRPPNGGDLKEIPANTVRFVFTKCEDPDRPQPLSFAGSPFDIPTDPSKIEGDNQKQRYEIMMRRLKGHLSTILGSQATGNLGDDIARCVALAEDETATVVKVEIRGRTHKNKRYKTEYVNELVSGPGAGTG